MPTPGMITDGNFWATNTKLILSPKFLFPSSKLALNNISSYAVQIVVM